MKVNERWKTQYLLLWCGQGSSLLTSSILQMSIVWYLTETTQSASILAAAFIFGFAPQAFLGPIIGTFIDKFDRKKVMIVSDLSISSLSLLLFLIGITSSIPTYLIYLVLALRSLGTAFQQPAFDAIIPSIVPKEFLASYAGYSQSFKSLSMILSPALGATFYSLWGLNAVIALDVIGTLVATLFLLILKTKKYIPPTKLNKTHILKDSLDGFNILRNSKGLFPLLIIGSIYPLAYIPIGTLFPFITLTYFNGTVSQSGLVEIIYSASALAGALLLAKVINKLNKVIAMGISIFCYGIGSLVTGLLPSSGLLFFMVMAGLMGIAAPFFFAVKTSVYQSTLPEEYMGRAFAIDHSCKLIAMPLSLAISGFCVETLGVNIWYFILGVFTVILSFFVFFLPSVRKCLQD